MLTDVVINNKNMQSADEDPAAAMIMTAIYIGRKRTRLCSGFFRKLQEITNKQRHFCVRPLDPLTIIIKREKPTSWRPTSSSQQPIFTTEASQNRTVLYSETVSVDGCQTAFSVNGNTVHTWQISPNSDC